MLLLYTTQHEAGLITFRSSLHTINTEAVYWRTGATALSMHTKLISCLYEVENNNYHILELNGGIYSQICLTG